MSMITLSNKIRITSKYSGKSKFPFWTMLAVGDVMTISLDVKPTGRNRGSIYVPYLRLTYGNGLESFSGGFNDIQKYLGKIGYEILGDTSE